MNSPYAKIFLALMAHVEAEMPEIKYIDMDLGQLEGNSIRPAVAFPCVLFDFKGFVFENMGNNAQLADGQVLAKLGFAQFTNSSNLTDPLYKEFALEYFELEWKLNNILHGWSPGAEFGYLTRTNVDSENRPNGIRLRPILYRLDFEDYSAQLPALQKMSPAPVKITN